MNGKESETGIPFSNVIKFSFDDGSWYAVRPSGTEPKLKIYIYSRSKNKEEALSKVERIERIVLGRIESVE